jgi:hypothetical protein
MEKLEEAGKPASDSELGGHRDSFGKQPQKLNGTLTAAFGDSYFLRTNQLLVACHAPKRVARGTGVERRNGNGIAALYAFFGSELSPMAGSPLSSKMA